MRLEEFRLHVLALMLVDSRFLVVANVILQPRYFENPLEQTLCRVVLEHFREYKKAPKRVSVLNRANQYFKVAKSLDITETEFRDFLDEVIDCREAAADQATYIADEVVKFCRQQAVKEATLKNAEDISKGDLTQVVARMEKAMATGAELQGKGVFLFNDAKDCDLEEEIRVTIPTGLPFIDKPLHGGLARQEMGLIIAPPNTGKTTALVNIGSGIAKQRFKVAHLTCEMGEKPVLAMYRQCYTNKTRNQLVGMDTERQQVVAEWLFKQRCHLKSDINIKHWSAHRLSTEGIKAHLLMLESLYGFKPDALLLDYMDLLMMPTHIRDEVKQLTWTGEELRAIAEEHNLALWTATQTNRGGSQKETARMDDVAGDFMKNATADVVITLNQTLKEQEEDVLRWFYAKSRAGKKHMTYTTITNFDKSRIEVA